MPNIASKKLSFPPKDTIVSTFLVAEAFIWFLSGFSYLQGVVTNPEFGTNSLLTLVTVNFVSLILSGFIVSSLASKLKHRLVFIKYWIVAGALISILFAFVNLADYVSIMVLASIVGMHFGIGMPICMNYYAKTTQPNNRAKGGGIIILLIGVLFPLISIIGGDQVVLLAGALAVCQIVALCFILGFKPAERKVEEKENVSYRSVVSDKTFLLYVVPWFMFSLINDLTMQLNTNHFNSSLFPPTFGQTSLLVENVLAGAAAIICGILADRKGRKRLALTGLALLGIGYAALGLFSDNYFTAWLYICVDGVAWGAFSTLFLITIWGDIAQERSSEKFYLLGVLPYLFSSMARILAGTTIASAVDPSMVFSFASFFLFVAILPLAYAPETLPEKIIKRIELNGYVEKALEKAKKENEKSLKKE